MIFFNIPTVGHLKPETLFGNDDHYGFFKTISGEKYDRSKIKIKCSQYYLKDNEKYWDQIITIANFLGIKRLDKNQQFLNIPLLDYFSNCYDNGYTNSSTSLFQFYLSQWQFPHPILTGKKIKYDELNIEINEPRKNLQIIKPYSVILKILNEMFKLDKQQCFFLNDEFYSLVVNAYRNNFEGFNINNAKNIALNIIEMRNQDNTQESQFLKSKTNHLNPIKGFLKNSYFLTTDFKKFKRTKTEFFIGLDFGKKHFNEVDTIIKLTEKNKFNFDKNQKSNDPTLNYNFSIYNNDIETFKYWSSLCNVYDTDQDQLSEFLETKQNNIFDKSYKFTGLMDRIDQLDPNSVSKRRSEQYVLKEFLFQNINNVGTCSICSKSFPLELLVTMYIKRRHYCTEEEKKDTNVIIPVCTLGCESLFENNYIVVKEGMIKSNTNKTNLTHDLIDHLQKVNNTPCLAWNENRKQYFEYHARQEI